MSESFVNKPEALEAVSDIITTGWNDQRVTDIRRATICIMGDILQHRQNISKSHVFPGRYSFCELVAHLMNQDQQLRRRKCDIEVCNTSVSADVKSVAKITMTGGMVDALLWAI